MRAGSSKRRQMRLRWRRRKKISFGEPSKSFKLLEGFVLIIKISLYLVEDDGLVFNTKNRKQINNSSEPGSFEAGLKGWKEHALKSNHG